MSLRVPSKSSIGGTNYLNSSGNFGAKILNTSADGSDDGDVTIRRLNESVSDMVSVGNESMAGLSDMNIKRPKHTINIDSSMMSDTSGGQIVKVTGANTSMVSGTSGGRIVRVTSANDTSDMNMSMAGLSDMSMGEVQRVNNDSMADYSMASLQDQSMAGVNDSDFQPKRIITYAEEDEDEEDSKNNNILDDLKQELAEEEEEAQSKGNKLSYSNRVSVVVEGNEDEYDSEEDDNFNKPRHKKSLRMSLHSSRKLADLAKQRADNNDTAVMS